MTQKITFKRFGGKHLIRALRATPAIQREFFGCRITVMKAEGPEAAIVTATDTLATLGEQQFGLPGKGTSFQIGIGRLRLPFTLAAVRAKSPPPSLEL
jgi:hypothetical protein